MTDAASRQVVWRSHAGIPIRSLWTLLVYAHGLAEFIGRFDSEAEDAADLPELLARLLVVVVERRLRRELSRAYQPRAEVLTRVRGGIDLLTTERRQLLSQGRVACRYQARTLDTARNRLVRAALTHCGARVQDGVLSRDCLQLSRELGRRGVGADVPSRAEMAQDQVVRHDAEDRLLVTVARLALAETLPGETEGLNRATALARHETLLQRIFEAAVAGVYSHHLNGQNGWKVHPHRWLDWRPIAATPGLAKFLPQMQTDVVLEQSGRRLVIDTKFTALLTRNAYGDERFKSGHIYQLYAYLRSQEGLGSAADEASGLLLYPALDLQSELDEEVTLQGHRVRFATIDLATEPAVWRDRLLELASSTSEPLA